MTHSDAEGRTTAVAEAMADALKRSGSISHPFSSDAERETLRRAGRRAGRMLNRPVHTTVVADRVHIAVTDWGENPLEAQLSEIRANKAIDAALAAEDDSQPSGPHPRR